MSERVDIAMYKNQMLFSDMHRHYSLAWPVAGSCIGIIIVMSVCEMLYSHLDIDRFTALALVFSWIRMGELLVIS